MNSLTFDLDLWHTGLPGHRRSGTNFEGQGHVKVIGGEKTQQLVGWLTVAEKQT